MRIFHLRDFAAGLAHALAAGRGAGVRAILAAAADSALLMKPPPSILPRGSALS
jgi:hypothetical protein